MNKLFYFNKNIFNKNYLNKYKIYKSFLIYNKYFINYKNIHKFSTILPKNFFIPINDITFKFIKSQGPGGQNVNKLNTQVEIRLKPWEVHWLPHDVKYRLMEQQKTRINNNNELIITSQIHRTQYANRKECIKKLTNMIEKAWIKPKKRIIKKELSEKTKEKRIKYKKKRSQIKEGRRKKTFDY